MSAQLTKVIYLVDKLAGMSDEAFKQHWTTTHAELAQGMPGLRGYSINMPSAQQRSQRAKDGYAALWFDDREALKAAWGSAEGQATAKDGTLFMAGVAPIIIDEEVVVAPDPAAHLTKVIYLVDKLAGMSDEAFKQHWTTTHAELAQGMPGLRGYSINMPSAQQRSQRAKDGYAALWFDDREALKAAWGSAEGQATAKDGTLFMAGVAPIIVDELVVCGPAREGQL